MRRIVALMAAFTLAAAPALAVAQGPEPEAGAASVPNETIGKAGAALHDVAKVQQKYQGQMDSASPAQKKGLSEKANAEAVQAIQSHGISVQEYSNVMRMAQNDAQVRQRVLDAAKQGE